MVAAMLLFSGCNLMKLVGGNNKPTPSAADTEDPTPSKSPKPSPSEKPSPSVKPSPSPEAEGPPSQSNGGHLFGGSSAPSSSGGAGTAAANNAVQDAQLQVYYDESLSSTEDLLYTDNVSVRADYDGNGTEEILDIDFSYDYPQSDDMNFPVMVTLTIDGNSIIYENTWNDGVAVGIADFDSNDAELDIYIISLGTDVSAYVQTYWYDGASIEAFTWFEIIEETAFWYDTQGYIYYRGVYEEAYGVMVMLDFYTGDLYTIE